VRLCDICWCRGRASHVNRRGRLQWHTDSTFINTAFTTKQAQTQFYGDTTSCNLQFTFATCLYAIATLVKAKPDSLKIAEMFQNSLPDCLFQLSQTTQTGGEQRTDRKLTMLLITSTTIAPSRPRLQYQIHQLDPLD
jgi:hypothetical protein